MPTLCSPGHDHDAAAIEAWRLRSVVPRYATAGPPARSETGHQLELLLIGVHERLSALATVLTVQDMAVTGEHPAIRTVPNYDVGGLEADSEFSASFAEAVERGRRFEADMPTDWADIDIDY